MNIRYHRIIRTSPNKAELAKNKNKVNDAMTLYRQKAFQKKWKKKAAKFQIGDFVRIQCWKNKFARGYDRNFTTEIFDSNKNIRSFTYNNAYRVSHNLWQFRGNWLQIVNYGRYSNFKAIFEMPCLFNFRKVQKITHSAKIRVLK